MATSGAERQAGRAQLTGFKTVRQSILAMRCFLIREAAGFARDRITTADLPDSIGRPIRDCVAGA
jgi:hypothetical protein